MNTKAGWQELISV